MLASDISELLDSLASEERRKANMWFFKTGPGQYGEGDKFIGVTVPQMRSVAKKFKDIVLSEVTDLVRSPIHEERLMALFIMVSQFQSSKDDVYRERIFNEYLRALDGGYVNNWDLVDSSAHKIVGIWLEDKDRGLLYELADSNKLWHQRVSMMSCMYYISRNDFDDALAIGEKLLHHEHDLIHKVVGWMLREIGKRHMAVEEKFLKAHQKTMPRTMLRYAIEKFPESKRQMYLKGIA